MLGDVIELNNEKGPFIVQLTNLPMLTIVEKQDFTAWSQLLSKPIS